MKHLLPAVLLMSAAFFACSSPPPTCAPGEREFKVCSDGSLYSCPTATPAQLADKQMKEASCDGKPERERIDCLFGLDLVMIDMALVAACEDGGQMCVETATAVPSDARCEA